MDDSASNGIHGSGNSLPMTSLRNISSGNNNISSSNSSSTHTTQSHGYIPIAAKGHKESVYALAMNEGGSLLVSGGTEKVWWGIDFHFGEGCEASVITRGIIRDVFFVFYPMKLY